MTTPLPRAITRDETEHGKLYYTRQQLIEYGRRCAEEATMPAPKHSDDSGFPEALGELFGRFGRKA